MTNLREKTKITKAKKNTLLDVCTVGHDDTLEDAPEAVLQSLSVLAHVALHHLNLLVKLLDLLSLVRF